MEASYAFVDQHKWHIARMMLETTYPVSPLLDRSMLLFVSSCAATKEKSQHSVLNMTR